MCVRVKKNGIAGRASEHVEKKSKGVRCTGRGPGRFAPLCRIRQPVRSLWTFKWMLRSRWWDRQNDCTPPVSFLPLVLFFGVPWWKENAVGCKRVSFWIFWSRRTAHYSRGQLYNYIAELPKAFTWIGGINSIMLVYIALTLGERHSRLIHQGAAAEGLMCWLYLSRICALWYTRPPRHAHIKTSPYYRSCFIIPKIQSGWGYSIVTHLVGRKMSLIECTNLTWFQITTVWSLIYHDALWVMHWIF